VVERTGSTNADLLARRPRGAPDRTVLVAEHQDAGAAAWPQLGLPARVGAHRERAVPARRRAPVALRLAAAAGRAGRAGRRRGPVAGVPAGLKWPNDLLVGDPRGRPGPRKAAGILGRGRRPDAARRRRRHRHQRRRRPARPARRDSLAAVAGRPVDRVEVLVALLTRLSEREAAWRTGRGDADATRLRADYRAGCASLGSHVRVELPAARRCRASPRTSTPTAGCCCSTPRATGAPSRRATSCTCGRRTP
jgi:BirA family biotin operon repressor/biotin-[acetyl-CoA-carboxylase] ligase